MKSIVNLVLGGQRDIDDVNDVLQVIKDRRDFANIFVRADNTIAGIFRLQVNYDLNVKEAIKAGKYDWENDDINDKNFLSKRSGSALIDIRLVHFNKDMSFEDVLKELNKMGLRPAKLPELLALGAECPAEQRKYPVVALGSVWQDSLGDRSVPCLDRPGSERGLGLCCFEGDWGASFRFAAVCK